MSGRKPEDKHSNLFCMYMNARSLKKNIHTQGNVYVSNLIWSFRVGCFNLCVRNVAERQ